MNAQGAGPPESLLRTARAVTHGTSLPSLSPWSTTGRKKVNIALQSPAVDMIFEGNNGYKLQMNFVNHFSHQQLARIANTCTKMAHFKKESERMAKPPRHLMVTDFDTVDVNASRKCKRSCQSNNMQESTARLAVALSEISCDSTLLEQTTNENTKYNAAL